MVAHDCKIYVFGGGYAIESEEGWSDEVCQTAEVYDPVKDEWESIPPMSTARIGAGAASLGGKIFVVGGCGNDFGALASGECYDPKTKIWTRIPNTIDAEGEMKAVAIDGILFVAECNGSVIEKYSPKSNSWKKISDDQLADVIRKNRALCTLNMKYLPKFLMNELNMNNNNK